MVLWVWRWRWHCSWSTKWKAEVQWLQFKLVAKMDPKWLRWKNGVSAMACCGRLRLQDYAQVSWWPWTEGNGCREKKLYQMIGDGGSSCWWCSCRCKTSLRQLQEWQEMLPQIWKNGWTTKDEGSEWLSWGDGAGANGCCQGTELLLHYGKMSSWRIKAGTEMGHWWWIVMLVLWRTRRCRSGLKLLVFELMVIVAPREWNVHLAVSWDGSVDAAIRQ